MGENFCQDPDSSVKQAPKRRSSGRKFVGDFLLRLAGLFFLGLAIYWFNDEISVHGKVARWDLAIFMLVAGILGSGMLLRPGFVFIVGFFLLYFLYFVALAYEMFVCNFFPGFSTLCVTLAPLAVVLFGGFLRAPPSDTTASSSASEGPTSPPRHTPGTIVLRLTKVVMRIVGVAVFAFGAMCVGIHLATMLLSLHGNALELAWDRLFLLRRLLLGIAVSVLGLVMSSLASRRQTRQALKKVFSFCWSIILVGPAGLRMAISSLRSKDALPVKPKNRLWASILFVLFLLACGVSMIGWLPNIPESSVPIVVAGIGVLGVISCLLFAREPGVLVHIVCFVGVVFGISVSMRHSCTPEVQPLIWEKEDETYAGVIGKFSYLQDQSIFQRDFERATTSSDAEQAAALAPGIALILTLRQFPKQSDLKYVPPRWGQTVGQAFDELVRLPMYRQRRLTLDRTFREYLPGDLIAPTPSAVKRVVILGDWVRLSTSFGITRPVIPYLVFDWPDCRLMKSGLALEGFSDKVMWPLSDGERRGAAKRIEDALR